MDLGHVFVTHYVAQAVNSGGQGISVLVSEGTCVAVAFEVQAVVRVLCGVGDDLVHSVSEGGICQSRSAQSQETCDVITAALDPPIEALVVDGSGSVDRGSGKGSPGVGVWG